MTGLLGYQSAWSDAASGKDLMGARWYNPAAGDFTSADTIPQSPLPDPAAGNPFAYAGDAPLDYTDPTGHFISLGGALDANYTHAQQVQTSSNVFLNDTEVQHYTAARAWSDANRAVADLPISHPYIQNEIAQYDANLLATERRDDRIHEHRIWRRAQAAKKAARERGAAQKRAIQLANATPGATALSKSSRLAYASFYKTFRDNNGYLTRADSQWTLDATAEFCTRNRSSCPGQLYGRLTTDRIGLAGAATGMGTDHPVAGGMNTDSGGGDVGGASETIKLDTAASDDLAKLGDTGGVARGADFIADQNGTVVSTSRARLEGGLQDAGFPSSRGERRCGL